MKKGVSLTRPVIAVVDSEHSEVVERPVDRQSTLLQFAESRCGLRRSSTTKVVGGGWNDVTDVKLDCATIIMPAPLALSGTVIDGKTRCFEIM